MTEAENVIEKTKSFVKQALIKAEPGHDWWHAYRVYNLSLYIARKEKYDHIVPIQLSALLHDIADSKFYEGVEEIGAEIASDFLKRISVRDEIISQVVFVIENISFRKGANVQVERNKILDIVQDADRLDAIGAIGIARAFSYGGHKSRPIYDPCIPPKMEMTGMEYKINQAPTLNHFYEKLFKLKSLMNTQTGKELAEERHLFMERFVSQFYWEWNIGE